MAQWDPETGKVPPTWTVRFSAWSIFLGCTIGAVVTSVVCSALLRPEFLLETVPTAVLP